MLLLGDTWKYVLVLFLDIAMVFSFHVLVSFFNTYPASVFDLFIFGNHVRESKTGGKGLLVLSFSAVL